MRFALLVFLKSAKRYNILAMLLAVKVVSLLLKKLRK